VKAKHRQKWTRGSKEPQKGQVRIEAVELSKNEGPIGAGWGRVGKEVQGRESTRVILRLSGQKPR